MTIGFAVFVFGYAVFYWGLHHFPGCLGTCQCKGCCKRWSLFQLLGIDTAVHTISTTSNQPIAPANSPPIVLPMS